MKRGTGPSRPDSTYEICVTGTNQRACAGSSPAIIPSAWDFCCGVSERV